jgi:hypothetical protein
MKSGDIIKLKKEIDLEAHGEARDICPGDLVTIKCRNDRFGIALTPLVSLAPRRAPKRPIRVMTLLTSDGVRDILVYFDDEVKIL